MHLETILENVTPPCVCMMMMVRVQGKMCVSEGEREREREKERERETERGEFVKFNLNWNAGRICWKIQIIQYKLN